MLVKGNGPANGLLLPATLLGGTVLAPTFGTTVSGGHTTLGDLNCTCTLLLLAGTDVAFVCRKVLISAWPVVLLLLLPSEKKVNVSEREKKNKKTI